MSKQGVLAILDRAASDLGFIGQLTDAFPRAVRGYALTREEYAALASGDVRWIEVHCGKLDERLRVWLDCRLGQEVWGLATPVEERAELEESEAANTDTLLRLLLGAKAGVK